MDRDDKHRFSVVIPCYNEANFLANTLISLKAQDTSEKIEIIIVDNNCTDDTVKIARQFGARIITEKTPGVCWARQAGTEAAKGEIVISTDADTVFSPSWLSNIDRGFRSNKKIVAVGGPCRYVDGPWWGKAYPFLLFGGVYAYSLMAGCPFYITATNIAFKKSEWVGYDLSSMQGGDELGLLHGLREKGKVKFINSNPTFTSGRRLDKGFTYNLFVTFLFYYLGAYYINKIFKRSIIGSAPAFRNSSPADYMQKINVGLASLGLVVLITFSANFTLRSYVTDNLHDVSISIANIWKAIS